MVPTISIEELDDNTFLLDVRELAEWAAGRAPRAVHIPMTEIPARVTELPADTKIAVICRSGARSHDVTAYLREHHGIDAVNVVGGMKAWARAGCSLVADHFEACVI